MSERNFQQQKESFKLHTGRLAAFPAFVCIIR